MGTPIVIFAYKRPWHTSQLLQSLSANKDAAESDIIVYIDGPKQGASADDIKAIDEVEEIFKQQTWTDRITIHKAKANRGLAASVINGVTETLKEYERVIVLEDDLILSPYFLKFMEDGLTKYSDDDRVISVHGYCVPIKYDQPCFFLRGADCWGWATWKRGWDLFNENGAQLLKEIQENKYERDFDFNGTYPYSLMLKKQVKGKVNSWAIRWYASAYLQNKLTLYPSRSLVQNTGGDGSGTHTQDPEMYRTAVSDTALIIPDIPVKESTDAKKLISDVFRRHQGIVSKIKGGLNKIRRR